MSKIVKIVKNCSKLSKSSQIVNMLIMFWTGQLLKQAYKDYSKRTSWVEEFKKGDKAYTMRMKGEPRDINALKQSWK